MYQYHSQWHMESSEQVFLYFRCTMSIFWNITVSQKGDIKPKIDLLMKIPEQGKDSVYSDESVDKEIILRETFKVNDNLSSKHFMMS